MEMRVNRERKMVVNQETSNCLLQEYSTLLHEFCQSIYTARTIVCKTALQNAFYLLYALVEDQFSKQFQFA